MARSISTQLPSSTAFSTTLLALALFAIPACSSSSSPPATSETPTLPTPGAPGATAAPPAPTGTADPDAPAKPAVTTIRVHYASSAHTGALTLRGSSGPLSWDTGVPLAAAGPVYTWSSADVKSEVEVKPLLDATWSRGPNYKVKPGQTVDLYPRFFESHGTFSKKYPSFVSQKLPSTRGVWVYLPPTYLENSEARMPVLYMHDAQNLFSPTTAFGGSEWKVDETLDAGAEDGTIRETIVVGIENTPARIDELTPTVDPGYGGGKADAYLAMVTTEIKPKIDQDLRTLSGREDTGIMGSSLGGLISAHAGVKNANVFGLVGEMSPSTWWDNRMIIGEVATTGATRPLRVYVDSGDPGDDSTNTKALAAAYEKLGYVEAQTMRHVVQPGGQHNETYWAQRLPVALQFLLGPR